MVDTLKLTVALGHYTLPKAEQLVRHLDCEGWNIVYVVEREGVIVLHCVPTPPGNETADLEAFSVKLARAIWEFSSKG